MTERIVSTPSAAPARASRRQIRRWGSVARLVVGLALVVAAVPAGADRVDLAIGLIGLPLVEILVLAARGRHAEPLRLYGNAGHFINWGVGIAAFTLLPQAAFIFYGASVLLAFARGYAGCEIAAISNWVRGRDDQIVCPLFSPIDQAEARRASEEPSC